MPSGWNTVNTFSDSLDDIKDSARTTREFANVMGRIVDMERLENHAGLNWDEVTLAKLSASNIDETTDLDENPQEIVDSLFTVTPTLVGMSVFMTDLARIRINAKVAAQLGVLTENAMARKKDIDLLAIGQSATTDLGTAGNPMASDIISAGVARIGSNSTEPWDGPVAAVLKGFHIKDLQDEGVAGFGTYPVPQGLTEQFYRKGFQGDVSGASVYKDDNISTDSADDAIAFVFGSGPGGAIVHVEGMEARRVTKREEGIGAGAEILYCTDQYGTGIRQQVWIYAMTADAASPTA